MRYLVKYYLILILAISNQAAAQHRNVLFIAVDDLKPLIGAYGDGYAITPNIDRLAAMGTTFTNAHCQQAVCAPSRASLLTGLRPDLTEVWDLQTQIRKKIPNILTMPQYLKENGYTTVGMGKIFDSRSVDRRHDAQSWSIPYQHVNVVDKKHGNNLFGFQAPENKKKLKEIRKQAKDIGVPPEKMWGYVTKRYKPSTEMLDASDEAYFDGALTVKAIEQLKELSKKPAPFFLAVGFHKPHLPFVAPKKYWDLYKRENLPLADYQQWAKGTVKLSYHDLGEMRSYTDIPESIDENGVLEESKQRELVHGYYACVSYIDAQIGKMLDELEAKGLRENTTIILWGDHGWHLGDHGLWCKHSNFEQATRSPLIIADSRMKAGSENSSPVEFVDIFPTLLDLLNLPEPDHLQGESLIKILGGKAKSVKEYAVSQYPRGKIMGYTLRDDRYRFVAWYKGGRQTSNVLLKELYDYKKDPDEMVNIVADRPDLATTYQKKLEAFLIEQRKQKKEFRKSQNTTDERNSPTQVKRSKELGVNLMSNPGFENGKTAWSDNGECTISVVKDNAKSGKSSLMLTGTRCSSYQIVKGLQPETQYRVSAFIKTENGEAGLLAIAAYGGELIRKRYLGSSYGEVTADFTTGPDNTSVRIGLAKYFKGAIGSTWFDDVSLKQVGISAKEIEGPPIKEILKSKYRNEVYVGATIAHKQLDTDAEYILTSQFNYTVAENAGKQARVHPSPGQWNWREIDEVLGMAQKSDLMVRLHGPISPQASQWAKNDSRTADELLQNMTEFMTEQCKRYNGHPQVRWMDVVNETVTPAGEWFEPKPGVKQWENPWTIIGADKDKNKTPLYISKAFEIANEHAPEISLVFNQHGGMQPGMWDKVKETILYLRKKGLRVDGLGWQAHLRSDKPLANDPEQLKYLSELIDWAHANNLDFHVTEIDYKIMGEMNEEAQRRHAEAYSNIMKVLLAKASSGLVTFNTWGIMDRPGKHTDKWRFLFTNEGKAKPAFYALKNVLFDTLPLD
ncbi:sulfatase-like hydrolase/transferase [Reichenbachiella sp.]|uniref:sulfatase-like hydrolase/transferase n=1 Tax=Reichenbachiella sp. TaxID=2184521 RepID=UPI0032984E0F